MNLFGLFAKISLDTSEYDKKVKESSEGGETLKKSTTEIGNAADVAATRIKMLGEQHQAAKNKVAELSDKFLESAKNTGTQSKETQELEKQLKEAENEVESISRELSQYSPKVEETSNQTEKAAKSTSEWGDKLKNGLVAGLKAAGTAIAATTTAIAGLTTKAVESYAEYEQLVGGVDTIFKDASQQIQDYASVAYETAGLSANQYMETVTGFSASLIQSLSGNTEQAAEIANMAIIDMADNANKMGTSMESIQNAYQGFAKQNYTMLDNLKLGYGGTKEEMQRLIEHANELKEAMGETGDLSIESFADVVEAIHLVQNELDITGTTAKEASTTIQGSLSSMKSAFQNLLTGLANENANLDKLIEEALNSTLTFAENIIPAIQTTLTSLTTIVSTKAQELIGLFLNFVMDLLPQVIQTGTDLLVALVDGIVSNIKNVSEAAFDIVMTLIDAIINLLPKVVEAGLELILTLAEGLINNIEHIIASATKLIIELCKTLLNSENIQRIMKAALDLIVGLANGLLKAIPELMKAAPEIIQGLIDGLINSIPMLFDAALEIVSSLANYFLSPEGIETVLTSGWEIIQALVRGIFKAQGTVIESAGKILSSIIDTFKSGDLDLLEVGENLLLSLWNGVKNVANEVIEGIKGVVSSVANAVTGIWDTITGGGDDSNNSNSTSSGKVGKGGIVINQTINASKMTPSEAFASAEYAQEKALLLGAR